MNIEITSKVTPEHLQRNAYLYVRQSTLRQVVENTESTQRQYELRRRATALGWPEPQIVTIDSDLGQSGACAADRIGFQKLVAEVSMNRAGIVLGLEVSRLARNSSDWHRLLELCAYNHTLILDEEGVYDPNSFNDRLLLGLKGTMSEAELHVLYCRLHGGIVCKARRGELKIKLPIGFVYDARDKVVIDPDRQVQQTIELFFESFFRLGSAMAAVKYFRNNKIQFPRRINGGAHHDELIWGKLGYRSAVHMLHNPRFAGCYFFGRRRSRKRPDGVRTTTMLPRDKWISLIEGAHPGYITWPQFEQIQCMITETAKAYGQDRRHGPPREGPALLQGRVVCGRCGNRMTVRYRSRPSHPAGLVADYCCLNRGPAGYDSPCQTIAGAAVDDAIGRLIIDSVTTDALQIAVAVEDELKKRDEQIDLYRKTSLERAQYEADLSRQRYMKVDPNNRLVADSLEADWNDKLRAVEQAYREYEEKRKADARVLNDEARGKIFDLAKQFPAIWNNPLTPAKERKRMLGLLIEDVTILRQEHLMVQVRFRGGATRSLQLPLPLNAWQRRTTNLETVRMIDELSNEHTDQQIVQILNSKGLLTGAGDKFTTEAIQWLRYNHELKSFKQRLIDRGMLTATELAKQLGVRAKTIPVWRRAGYLSGRKISTEGNWMYEIPDPSSLPKSFHNRKRGRTDTNAASTATGAV
jgi:DNA invertase Pin-like site-specific DNA recombinase